MFVQAVLVKNYMKFVRKAPLNISDKALFLERCANFQPRFLFHRRAAKGFKSISDVHGKIF